LKLKFLKLLGDPKTFHIFLPEKYDFNTYKQRFFFVKEMSITHHISRKKSFESPDFYNEQVANFFKKEFLNVLLSYLIYSQIWLNLLIDDH